MLCLEHDDVTISLSGHVVHMNEYYRLEVGAVWDPLHVEEFLRDYYAGRENISLKLIDVLGNYKFKG
jgi:hypothetical protein